MALGLVFPFFFIFLLFKSQREPLPTLRRGVTEGPARPPAAPAPVQGQPHRATARWSLSDRVGEGLLLQAIILFFYRF